eukprot:843159-Prymnesium_polylepis.1
MRLRAPAPAARSARRAHSSARRAGSVRPSRSAWRRASARRVTWRSSSSRAACARPSSTAPSCRATAQSLRARWRRRAAQAHRHRCCHRGRRRCHPTTPAQAQSPRAGPTPLRRP